MSRDTHKQDTTPRPAPQPWFWLLIGLLIGTVGVLLFPPQHWFSSTKADPAQNKTAALPGAAEIEKTGATPIAPTDFKFYTLLPKMEVAVPKSQRKQPPSQPQTPSQPEADSAPATHTASQPEADSSSATHSASQPQSPSQPQPQPTRGTTPSPKLAATPPSNPKPATYVLQAGSFRSQAQADKREAYLALLGVEAAIQTVTTDSNKTWHRVRIGPSTNLSKLRRIREQLGKEQIKSLLYEVSS